MGLAPKKHLGQHFLRDREVAVRMVELLKGCGGYDTVLEIGPGEGVLTRLLLSSGRWKVHAVEVDAEAVAFLKGRAEFDELVLHEGDVRRVDFGMLPVPVGVIGNLPYHLSSDIVLRLVSVRDRVSEGVCMFQKEVALRLSGKAGSRHYGRLSVLAQTYYDITYAFSVASEAFFPKPKVESAVLCWRRNQQKELPVAEAVFSRVVKQAFAQRRKMLRNALADWLTEDVEVEEELLKRRAEDLTVEDFIHLARALEKRVGVS